MSNPEGGKLVAAYRLRCELNVLCARIKTLEKENEKLKDEILDLKEQIDAYEWAMGI